MKVHRKTFISLRSGATGFIVAPQPASRYDRYRKVLSPFFLFLFFACFLLFLSVISSNGRYFLIVLSATLLVLLWYRVKMEMIARSLYARYDVDKRIFREGDDVKVVFELENLSAFSIRDLLVEDYFSPGEEPYRRVPISSLPARSRMRCHYVGQCKAGMGKMKIGPLLLNITDPLGVFEFEVTATEMLEIEVLPHIEKLPLIKANPTQSYGYIGRYDVLNRGSSVSLAGIREYSPGDSVRSIAWRLSTRGRGLMVKDFEKSINAAVNIVLNLEPYWQIGRGAESTWEYAKDIALALVSKNIEEGNSVGLFSENLVIEPSLGENHFALIASKVANLDLSAVTTERSAYILKDNLQQENLLKKYQKFFSQGSEIYYIVPYNELEYDFSRLEIRRLQVSGFQMNIVFLNTAAFWQKHYRSISLSNLVSSDVFKNLPTHANALRREGVRVFLASPAENLARAFIENAVRVK